MRKSAAAGIMAILLSFGLQGGLVVLGSLFGGYFGTPIPDGDSGGISNLIGGFLNFSLLRFIANVCCTSVPLFLLARHWPPRWTGRLIGILLLATLVAVGPVLQMALRYQVNARSMMVGMLVALIAASLAGTWAPERSPGRA